MRRSKMSKDLDYELEEELEDLRGDVEQARYSLMIAQDDFEYAVEELKKAQERKEKRDEQAGRGD